jgi:hypothetical protein
VEKKKRESVFLSIVSLTSLCGYMKFRGIPSVMDDVKSEGKVVPVLFLTEHHAMKTYWGGGIDPCILELDGGGLSASRPGRFTPRERARGTHWIGGWVGSGAVLDMVVKRKILSPRRESKPRTPIVQPVV